MFAFAKKSAPKLIGGAAVGTGVFFSSSGSTLLSSSGFSVFSLESDFSAFTSSGFAAKLNTGALAGGVAGLASTFGSSDLVDALLAAGIPNEKPPVGAEAGVPNPKPALAVVASDADDFEEAGTPKLNFCVGLLSLSFSASSFSSASCAAA